MSKVKDKFKELYKIDPILVHSPGRINLIGEHTDYNDGFVMPAAIDKGIQLAIARSSAPNSQLYSIKYDQFFNVDISAPVKTTEPHWANYLLGVLAQVSDKEGIGNFNCVFDGDLPTGAGLSSSAAVECAFAFALNELFDLKLTRLNIITMAQWAEHNYVGVKCGIMDQFASVMGKKDQVMMLDCRSLESEYFPLELGENTLVLCDTNVKHSLASSEYNTRRNECEQGLGHVRSKYPEVRSLRDVSMNMLEDCKSLFIQKQYDRCEYVVGEIARVPQAAKDLQKGDLKAFGKKMFETHDGLSRLYQVSCNELDHLVELAAKFDGVLGSRMMGGGFGGCTINIVRKDKADEFIHSLGTAYKERFGKDMTTYVVQTGNGTSVIN